MKDLIKGKGQRMLSAFVIVLVLFAGAPCFTTAARVFTDIGDGEWYDTHVLEAYKAELITGYSDATFRPGNNISKVDVIICLSRLVGYAGDQSVDSYIQKHDKVMDSCNIQSWSKGYIAFGLEKGIVTEEELVTFIKSDGETANNAKRYEVAIYFAKALGLEQEARSYTNLVLSFVDNEIISQGSRGYIKTLLDRGIMKGDDTNRFNPNEEITRAEVATMLASSLGYADAGLKGITSLEGIVQEVVTGAGRTIIKIVLANGDIDMYDVAEGVDIKLNGSTSTLSNIATGQQGTFGIKDNKIVSIDIISGAAATKGVVRSVFDGSDYKSILIENDDGDRATYRVLSDTIIWLDGSSSSLKYINPGDRVSVTARGTDAVRIEAEQRTKGILGIFNGLRAEDKTILILKKGAEETEYPVDDNVSVRRDGRKRSLEDLRKGDEIDIVTEYGVIISIEAESRDRDMEGTLESLLIARPHQLTIKKDNGETETFFLPVDVSIKLDGKAASIYDLRLDYLLDIEVESDEIVRIKAEATAEHNELVGTVEYINTSVNVITLKVFDVSANANVTRQVNVNDDTRIINSSGTRRYIRHIEVGDRLVAVGHSELGVFIADTIMITNR